MTQPRYSAKSLTEDAPKDRGGATLAPCLLANPAAFRARPAGPPRLVNPLRYTERTAGRRRTLDDTAGLSRWAYALTQSYPLGMLSVAKRKQAGFLGPTHHTSRAYITDP